mgnify:FL=1
MQGKRECWEYDIRSSVVAWKMGYAVEYLQRHAPQSSVAVEFKATLSYLQDKKQFMGTLRYLVFGTDSDLHQDLQQKLLKQAFTALSFGARKAGKGWMDSHGNWMNPALVDIFRVKQERDRFIEDPMVTAFIAEQTKLDQFLFDGVRALRPDLLKLPYLQTQGGNPSRAKVVAFLYQHEETAVMHTVRATLREHNHEVLANIHDAIVVRRRISTDLVREIEARMQDTTGNPYWRLGAQALKRFHSALGTVDGD